MTLNIPLAAGQFSPTGQFVGAANPLGFSQTTAASSSADLWAAKDAYRTETLIGVMAGGGVGLLFNELLQRLRRKPLSGMTRLATIIVGALAGQAVVFSRYYNTFKQLYHQYADKQGGRSWWSDVVYGKPPVENITFIQPSAVFTQQQQPLRGQMAGAFNEVMRPNPFQAQQNSPYPPQQPFNSPDENSFYPLTAPAISP